MGMYKGFEYMRHADMSSSTKYWMARKGDINLQGRTLDEIVRQINSHLESSGRHVVSGRNVYIPSKVEEKAQELKPEIYKNHTIEFIKDGDFSYHMKISGPKINDTEDLHSQTKEQALQSVRKSIDLSEIDSAHIEKVAIEFKQALRAAGLNDSNWRVGYYHDWPRPVIAVELGRDYGGRRESIGDRIIEQFEKKYPGWEFRMMASSTGLIRV